jgi:hypothetical protein
LFKFEKDVDKGDLLAVREAFKTLIPATPKSAPNATLHLFDGDNVIIGIALFTSQEGFISGVKGDAFRVGFTFTVTVFDKLKKVEVRERKQ